MVTAKAFLPLILAACAVALAACGGTASPSFHYAPPNADKSAPPASTFPDPSGKTLKQVLNSTDGPLVSSGLNLEAAADVFYPGLNRFPMQVTNKAGESVDNVEIALYLMKQDSQKGRGSGFLAPAQGPFPAQFSTLATAPEFLATSTAEDPRSAVGVYVSDLYFPSNGEWTVAAIVKDGKRTFATSLTKVVVGEFTRVPRVGAPAPVIQTPTAESTDGSLASISTRRPPSTMNEVDFASVLARKPIVLIFASPRYSSNGTAGPTVDVAEQVRKKFSGRADFINVEVYNGDDPSNGVRRQVRAYHLPTQPWVFAINAKGRIAAEAEGAIGVKELTALADRATD
jgi:hypothetical protein